MTLLCCFLVPLVAWPAVLLVAVGTEAEVKPAPGATIIDVKERLVTPGCNDAHLHFLGAALRLQRDGVGRVRPVEGGFPDWRELGYPVKTKSLQESDFLFPRHVRLT